MRELPRLITEDPELHNWVWNIVHEHSPSRAETESRFDKMLAEIQRAREESERRLEEERREREESARRWQEQWEEEKRRWQEQWEEEQRRWRENERRWQQQWEESQRRWEEQQRWWEEQQRWWEEQRRLWEEQRRLWEEQRLQWQENERRWKEQQEEDRRRWEEQQRLWEEQRLQWQENERRWKEQQEEDRRRWEEQQRLWEENQQQIRRLDRRIDQTIGAIGARWGMMSEATFRNALRSILEENFGVKVERVKYKDESGEVFGRPDLVDLDVVIYNGHLLVCEIKSSASRADVYSFERKVRSYEKRVGRKADRAILISPMIHKKDIELARTLGIEVHTSIHDVKPE
jgi:hypothetical protein